MLRLKRNKLHEDIKKLQEQVFALRIDVDEIMELDDDVDDEACDC